MSHNLFTCPLLIVSNLSTRIKIAKEKIRVHIEVLGCYKVTISFFAIKLENIFSVLFDVNLFKVIFFGHFWHIEILYFVLVQ